jgi:hypothetical protein
LEEQQVPVEDKMERWRREAKEKEAHEAAVRHRKAADRAASLADARRHELEVARAANGVMDEDILATISQALNDLADRIEKIEDRLDTLDGDTPVKRTTVPLPGKFPWARTHPSWPGLKISQPVETKR